MKQFTVSMFATKEDLYKAKSEYLQEELNKLKDRESDTKNIIIKCFTNAPIGCDGMLLVSTENYNKLADHLNKE